MFDNSKGIKRRCVLKGMAAAGLASVGSVGARSAFAGDLDNKTFRFGTWGGSWRDSLQKLIGGKIEGRGAKVEYLVDSPTGNVAKLIAARGRAVPFDAMDGSPDLVLSMDAAKLVNKIDYSKLENAPALPAFARQPYYAITAATLDGIVYNTEKLKEADVKPPERYSDLINPKLAGRVAFPDINHTQHWNAVAALAFDAGGSEATLDKSINLVNQMKPAYFFSSSTDLATKFGSGEIWAAPWYAGFVVRLKRTGLPVAISYTHFGGKYGALWPILYQEIAGSPNIGIAEIFLDSYLTPEVQFAHAKFTGSLPMNPTARELLSKDSENKNILMFSDKELNDMFLFDFSKFDVQKWRDTWAREVKRS